MGKKESKEKNLRKHLRYRDPDSTVFHFFSKDSGNKETHFAGLIINESFKGMAIVFVGDDHYAKGDIIFWKETDSIHTACKVVRCSCLEDDVYSLALQIID
jgi:hypothetical protein